VTNNKTIRIGVFCGRRGPLLRCITSAFIQTIFHAVRTEVDLQRRTPNTQLQTRAFIILYGLDPLPHFKQPGIITPAEFTPPKVKLTAMECMCKSDDANLISSKSVGGWCDRRGWDRGHSPTVRKIFDLFVCLQCFIDFVAAWCVCRGLGTTSTCDEQIIVSVVKKR
jgi:hypothetical protein